MRVDEWKLTIANAQKCSRSRYARKTARATDELRRNTTVCARKKKETEENRAKLQQTSETIEVNQ